MIEQKIYVSESIKQTLIDAENYYAQVPIEHHELNDNNFVEIKTREVKYRILEKIR